MFTNAVALFLSSAVASSCDAADKALWDKDGKANFSSDERDCALQCGGQNPCTGDCMSRKVGYSHDCGQCFGALSSCVVRHCVVAPGNCGVNANGEACKSCTNQYCTPAFESCTGFTPPAAAQAQQLEIVCDPVSECPEELLAPLTTCTSADTKIWDSSGKAHFASDERTCALQCGGQNPCTGDCMSRKYGYSHGCGQCFGALSACVVRHCVIAPGNCGVNPNGSSCKSCTNKYCTPAFESCTGWTPPAAHELSWMDSSGVSRVL